MPTNAFNLNTIGSNIDEINVAKFYRRNALVVDKELRDEFVSKIGIVKNSAKGEKIANEQLSNVHVADLIWTPLPKHSNAFVKLSKIHIKGESNAWGKAITTIDTSAEEALAYFWDYCR